MHSTQFSELPPISDIGELFLKVTGVKLTLYTTWRTWILVDPEEYFIFQPYIRPCHQRILVETINGVQPNPCAFLRQLLRPYGLHIVKRNNQYKVCELSEQTVGKKPGTLLSWSEPVAPN
jgi:hypothetical protein